MATISILGNTVRPSVDRRLDDTTFEAGKFYIQGAPYVFERFLKVGVA